MSASRTARQHRIDRAIARALEQCGDYLLPDATLREEVTMAIVPRPTTAEIDGSLGHMDISRRVRGVQTEIGLKWRITDAGRDWLAENS